MALRLVLAEYNLLVREGLEQLLDGVDGVEVVGTCVELDSLLESIAEQRPDVVLTDIRMAPTRTHGGSWSLSGCASPTQASGSSC